MLETKDLIIKKGEQKDWKDLYYNIWSHSESAKYMLWNVTTSEQAARERMERTIAFEKNHDNCFVVYEKKSGQAIGWAGIEQIGEGVYEDRGVAIGPAFVGQGYGKQILNALTTYARDVLGAKKMVWSYRSQNVASKRVAEACGFTYSYSEDKIDPRNGEPYVVMYMEKELIGEEK